MLTNDRLFLRTQAGPWVTPAGSAAPEGYDGLAGVAGDVATRCMVLEPEQPIRLEIARGGTVWPVGPA